MEIALDRVSDGDHVIGGAAFVVDSDALSAVPAVSLVLLLLWVGALTYAVTRGGRLRPPRGAAA